MAAAMRQLAAEFEGKARAHQCELVWRPEGNRVLPWSASLDGFNTCVYSPVLRDELNGTEEAFARLPDGHPEVVAWLKNGDKGPKYFAIPYDLADDTHLFFPDFMAVLTDGRFGIWDTKGHGLGGTATDAVTVPIIERNSVVPTSRSHPFTTVQDNQTQIKLEVGGSSVLLSAEGIVIKSSGTVEIAATGKSDLLSKKADIL